MNKYIRKHQISLIGLFFLGIIFIFAQNVPYINLVVAPVWYVVILILLAAIFLKLSVKVLTVFSILSLLASIPWILVGSRVAAENLGIVVFFTVFIVAIKMCFALRKK